MGSQVFQHHLVFIKKVKKKLRLLKLKDGDKLP